MKIFFLKNGPNPASFCLFSFFSQCRTNTCSTNLTVNYKSVDGVLGTQTRGSRMEGADESTERTLLTFGFQKSNQMKNLPTMTSSIWDGFFRTRVQMSTVKMVDDELKMDVSEDISAANMTANIIPRSPAFLNRLFILFQFSNGTFPGHLMWEVARVVTFDPGTRVRIQSYAILLKFCLLLTEKRRGLLQLSI